MLLRKMKDERLKMKGLIVFILCSLFLVPASAQELLDYPLDTINGEEVYQYRVEKSIGLYRIGVNFNVPQADIVRLNPQLRERGVHYDEVLLIPTGRKVEKTKAKPQVKVTALDSTSVLVKGEVKVRDLQELKEEYQEVKMAIDSVLHQDTLAVQDSTVIDSIVDGRPVIELALLLPFESQQTKRSANADRMVEFYQGALLALRDVQNDSTLYRLRVYDTERSERRVAALCDSANTELDSVHGIIGLAYPIQIDRMSEWCKQHEVPLLLPFSNTVDLSQNAQLMQFNSTDAMETGAFIDWVSQRDSTIHCVLVDAKEAEVTGSIRELRQQLAQRQLSFSIAAVKNVMNDSLNYALDTARTNLVILPSDKFTRVRNMIPHLEHYATKGYDIRLLSHYSWQKEDIRMPQIYTSVFTGNAARTEYDNTWSRFFKNEHVSEKPRYDLLGYDLMRALVARLQGQTYSQGLQSDFQWEQTGEEGGWQNRNVKVVEK